MALTQQDYWTEADYLAFEREFKHEFIDGEVMMMRWFVLRVFGDMRTFYLTALACELPLATVYEPVDFDADEQQNCPQI